MANLIRQLSIVFLYLLGVALCLWLMAAASAWEWHNPKGNRTTFLTHFEDAMHFRRLEEFQ